MNYESQIIDYLVNHLESFDLSESEKEELAKYACHIAKKSSKIYSFMESDENKEKIIALFESIAEKKNV